MGGERRVVLSHIKRRRRRRVADWVEALMMRPPAATRLFYPVWWVLGFCVAGLMVMSLGFAVSFSVIANVALLAVFVVLGAMAISLIRFGRLIARVVRERGRSCLGCGHSLAGLDDIIRCPECGYVYAARRVQRSWLELARVFYGRQKQREPRWIDHATL